MMRTRRVPRRPRSLGVVLAVFSVLLLAGLPRGSAAQVFELQGGGSSLYQGYGGALNVWGERFEGNVGVGYLDGLRFSVFLKQLIGRDTLRLGNDAIPVRFATDVFGTSNTIFAQGGGIHRATRRSSVYAFVGASAVAMPAPFVNALHQDQAIGVVHAERTLSPTFRLTTHALFSSRQTILQGIQWHTRTGLEAGATGGIGGNTPYGAASVAIKHEMVDLRAAYVSMGERFRRTGVPTPAQSEPDRENVLLTLRPAEGFSLGIGRQHFRQDSVLPGAPDRATLNQVFGSARLIGANVAAGLFDSRTPGIRTVSSYFSASRDLNRWLATDLYLLRVWSPAPARSTIPILHVREFITPRMSLLQVITHSAGRTSLAFGGALTSGLTSVGVDYQVVHTPYRPTRPFVQTIALNVRIPLGNYRVNAASFVTPDGRVNYTGSTSTFFYAGDLLTGENRPVEIKFERFIVEGTVVDEAGIAVDGAAIQVGGSTLVTDSRGRFFVRLSTSRATPVRVLLDDFLAPGRFEVVSAPSAVKPQAERESVPLKIVVRRAPPDRVSGEPAPTRSATTASHVLPPND
jgi:hypothetical protein